jgi:hypothetical protein
MLEENKDIETVVPNSQLNTIPDRLLPAVCVFLVDVLNQSVASVGSLFFR